MSCDEILSEITGHPTGQAFSHVDEFCNPRLMNFDEVFDIFEYGRFETRIEIVLPSLKKMYKLKMQNPHKFKNNFLHYGKFEYYTKFGIDKKRPIEAIFDYECIMECPYGWFQTVLSKPIKEKFAWNKSYGNFHVCISIPFDYCESDIDLEIGIHRIEKNNKQTRLALYTMNKNNDIVKFYDIGA
jgi:hypothetical protein